MTGKVEGQHAAPRDRSAAPLSEAEIAGLREALYEAGVDVPRYSSRNHRHGPDQPVLSALAEWAGWNNRCGIGERRRRARAWLGSGSPSRLWRDLRRADWLEYRTQDGEVLARVDRPQVMELRDDEGEDVSTIAVFGPLPDRQKALRRACRALGSLREAPDDDQVLQEAIAAVVTVGAANGRGIVLASERRARRQGRPWDECEGWRDALLDALDDAKEALLERDVQRGGDALALEALHRLGVSPRNRK